MISKEELSNYLRNHTNQDAANYFGVNVRTVARWVEKYCLAYYDLKHGDKPKQLNDFQKDVFVATMLGDASLLKDGRYRFKQRLLHLEYVKHVHEVMQPFSRNITSDWTRRPSNTNGKVIDLEKWNGDWLESKYFVTFRTPFFKAEREKWYVGRNKIIPDDLVLNPRICCYWSFDKGNNQPNKRKFTLATQSFSFDKVDNLRNMLKNLGISSSRQILSSGPIISISSRSYFDWIDMIKPFNTIDCLRYKTDVSNATMPKKGWGTKKLSYLQAEEIRSLYITDKYKQEDLAKFYGVTRETIWRIINYKTHHKTFNPAFGGTADVSLTFKVEACLSKTKTEAHSNCKDQIH